MTPTEWTPRADRPDILDRGQANNERGYIHEYAEDCNWQAWRNGYCLSGIVGSLEAAMDMADAMLALPIEEFNARVAVDLREKLRGIECELLRLQPDAALLRLQPDAALLPGFHAGYEQGVADTKRKIEAVLS
jgi:hypothetical protein